MLEMKLIEPVKATIRIIIMKCLRLDRKKLATAEALRKNLNKSMQRKIGLKIEIVMTLLSIILIYKLQISFKWGRISIRKETTKKRSSIFIKALKRTKKTFHAIITFL